MEAGHAEYLYGWMHCFRTAGSVADTENQLRRKIILKYSNLHYRKDNKNGCGQGESSGACHRAALAEGGL